MVLKLFPGITVQVIEHCLNMKGLKGVVLETYGSGNSPSESWFIKAMEAAVDRGILILNVSQCNGGRVIQGRYQTSMDLKRVGVLSGADITTEAAVTKMMFLLANESDETEIKRKLMMPLAGEMSVLNQ